MAIEGVGGNNPVNKKHTMESLNIKKDSYEASIFNEIDESDGNVDGYLTDNQYFVYKTKIALKEMKKEDMKILEQYEKEHEKKMKITNAKLALKEQFPDAKFNNEKQTVTIKSLSIYDFDISTIEKFEALKVRIVEQESINDWTNGKTF